VYNGENDIITMNARKVLEIVIGKLSEKEEFMMKLEAEINPLLDDNDQVQEKLNFFHLLFSCNAYLHLGSSDFYP